jgi:microcompartment protein CcmL/EutN
LPDFPAIALIEFSSIAAGTRASDILAKKAPIEILRAGTLQPGKYAILFAGEVAAVEESLLAGCHAASDVVLDRVLLPDVHESVRAAILNQQQTDWSFDTIGMIETTTMAAVLEAADAAVKGASIEIIQIRLGDGLGGKGLVYFGGLQADVEAALATGCARIEYRQQPICKTIIPRIDDAIRQQLAASTRFGTGW